MPSSPGIQQYDPTSQQPYQAFQAPEVAPPPPPKSFEQQPGYQFTGAPTTKLGAIAGVLDNIFRGYMRGKQEAGVYQAMKMKAKTDNLQNSYNQDAKLLYDMAQAGVDPNSAEFKQAVSAVQGSWGALQDWIGQHVNGDETKSKKKSKGKTVDQQQPQQQGINMADLQSPDPEVRARALYQMRQKMGPPVLWQVQQFYTPEAKQFRQARQQAVDVTTKQLSHESSVADAQAVIDNLRKKPESQWNDQERQQYQMANDLVNPPKLGEEALRSADELLRKASADPGYKFSDHDREMLRAAGYSIDPKKTTHVTARGEIIQSDEYGNFEIVRGPEKEYDPAWMHRAPGGGASGADKNYQKWRAYYKEHYPDMPDQDVDAMARRKVEGSSQIGAGETAHNAITEPKQFDNDVLSLAIDNLRRMPKYSDPKTTKFPNLDDALANIVGQGDDGYQYHGRKDLGQPDKGGKYSGAVTEDQLKELERDLQVQIRTVMTSQKLQGMSREERRAALNRMMPLFGPAAQGSATPPASPQAPGATNPASSSFTAPGGSNQFMATPNPTGLKESGNLPIWNRPTVRNDDGTHSSEYSTSFRDEKTGYEVLVPTVVNGKFLTPDGKKPREGSAEEKAMFRRAWDHYLKTGENLGKFDTPENADAYSRVLHNRGEQGRNGSKQPKGIVRKSAFLHENPGATDADWEAVKPQLKQQGYDPQDK